MDYYKFGKDNIEPLVKIMRQRKAGEIAAALNESGNFNDPRMGDPMVQDALGSQMKARQLSQMLPLEQDMKRIQIAKALQEMELAKTMGAAKARYYETRAANPSGRYSGKKYTGNLGNLMQLTDDIADLQEELADAQMNPDPDPDMQAKRLNRLQSQLQELATAKEIHRKKMEKEGAAPGGPSVTISTGPDGQPKQTIKGSLEHPETKKLLEKQQYPDIDIYRAMNEQQMSDTLSAAQSQIQWLDQQRKTNPVYKNPKGETIDQEAARLHAGIEGIGKVKAEKQAPATTAQPEMTAPKAKPVGRKAGATYQDANGNRAKFLGGDPSDPANYEAL